MTSTAAARASAGNRHSLPWAGLLALFSAGFLGIMNETVPAGLLPQMSSELRLPEGVVGQVTTVYAIATALTAIPLQTLFQRIGRRALVTWALAVFAAANIAAALIPAFSALLVARVVAGVAAGLIWSNIGGAAARIVPEGQQNRGVTIALAGTPIALALGLPAGTVLGDLAGWRVTFAAIAVLSVVVLIWTRAVLPALPATAAHRGIPLRTVMAAPGVVTIVLVTLGFVVAHNLLYTYIGPLTALAGLGDALGPVLLVFGVAALVSIWATGAQIERHHRALTITATVLLAAGSLLMAAAEHSPVGLFVGVAVWALGFGGAATLFLTAAMRAAGTDDVQAVVVTTFNVSIAVGGAIGGLLLGIAGAASIPWAALVLAVPVAVVAIAARRHAFPGSARRAGG